MLTESKNKQNWPVFASNLFYVCTHTAPFKTLWCRRRSSHLLLLLSPFHSYSFGRKIYYQKYNIAVWRRRLLIRADGPIIISERHLFRPKWHGNVTILFDLAETMPCVSIFCNTIVVASSKKLPSCFGLCRTVSICAWQPTHWGLQPQIKPINQLHINLLPCNVLINLMWSSQRSKQNWLQMMFNKSNSKISINSCNSRHYFFSFFDWTYI